MAPATTQPVIIGVGDIVNRSSKVGDAREPLDLMVQAIREAISDTGLDSSKADTLRSSIDSVNVVLSWTWPYPDLVGSICQRIGVDAEHRHLTPHGGNQSGKIFDETARRISQRKTKVAVLTGGEALASRTTDLPPSLKHTDGDEHSDCLRSCWATAASWLDSTESGSRQRLLSYHPGAPGQYVILLICHPGDGLIWFASRSGRRPRNWSSHPRLSTLRERISSTPTADHQREQSGVSKVVRGFRQGRGEESICLELWQGSDAGVHWDAFKEKSDDMLSMYSSCLSLAAST